jgi:hypothetical protein
LGLVIAAAAPVGAGQSIQCDVHLAASFRSAADRYVAERAYASAASWYLAAARVTRACGAADAALLGPRSLAQAGTAYAQSGDYGPALELLQTAQARLAEMGAAGNERTARAAQPYLEIVQKIIGAVNSLAESMM